MGSNIFTCSCIIFPCSQKGTDNNIGISEFNCRENYFEGNSFYSSVEGRNGDNGSEDNEKEVFIDFTVVLLLGICGFIIYLAIIEFIYRSKKYILFNSKKK